jgi:hypothetical protein
MARAPYRLIPVPLDVAGRLDWPEAGAYLLFQNAARADGSQDLNAKLRAKIGKDSVDYAIWQIDNFLDGNFDGFALEWDAQPGVTAFIYLSHGPDPLKLRAPPATQLVTSASGSTVANGVENIGAVAAVIVPANTLRQSLTLQNQGAVDVYIGGATVTAGGPTGGIKLAAGASIPIEKTTAAIYGITAAGAADVAFLSEES